MCANDSNVTGEGNNMDVLSTAKVLVPVSAGVHNKDRQSNNNSKSKSRGAKEQQQQQASQSQRSKLLLTVETFANQMWTDTSR